MGRTGGPEAVCVGETMAVLAPADGAPADRGGDLAVGAGGAEANTATGLAALGHRAAWAGRRGDDPFGRVVAAELRARGVDTSAVEIDPDRPTGVYLKDPDPAGSRVHYYRAGSAASAMGPHTRLPDGARLVHVSGITPALSAGCAALADRLLAPDRPRGGPLVSFDVNHRPALWSAERAAPHLLRLAARADAVFVGADEAARLWGARGAEEVRGLLPGVPLLVVKDAEADAVCFSEEGAARVPALKTAIVEPVGAGDAFAAGFLSGLLRGLPVRDRLRLGHLMAAACLKAPGDTAPPPPRAVRDRLLAADEEAWRSAVL
ncbi:sugar kinase [Nocardiopsis sp. RSe5-2]|uniref:Sugar kinase n=1 Tax=Nocardiopsis endophytica TaxID=3018445 RepID=A0ABT4UB94_9ACTN|nr:sugar kinase [Nocardiopsis endophytica]MDA2814239.1 sugar kinase [Nocardiopsis endophytica]